MNALIRVGVLLLAASTCFAAKRGDIPFDDQQVYPESITSTSRGVVISGSIKGNIYRAGPRDAAMKTWIRPTTENGLQAVFGVFADERSQTLWACSATNPFAAPQEGARSDLVEFDLKTGKFKATYQLPAPKPICNDIAVAANGDVYATDTPNGRIFRIKRGSKQLELFGEDEQLKGIDGIAFSGDGAMYINIVFKGLLMRVERAADGRMGAIVQLKTKEPLGGPDGMRTIKGNRFLLAEGTAGRIDEVTINGDQANIRVLRSGLNSSPGVTLVGKTVYTMEGKVNYLFDPTLKGQDPGSFKLIAVPLN